MRVLQLIDSLNVGGAERMAVCYANALVSNIESSHLCITRKEGILKETVSPRVGYIYLNKNKTFDFKAAQLLKEYLKTHHIDIIHAHTTSYFFAVLVKFIHPKIKIVWHEHQGNRIHQKILNNKVLYFSSRFFRSIFTVNNQLSIWCKENLLSNHVTYIPNFVNTYGSITPFEERKEEIICVANLKAPKNHQNLLRAFNIVHKKHPNWKLVLVGRHESNNYLRSLKAYISDNNLDDFVDIVGEQSNVLERMNMSSIGVLSSDNEGLPMALLEYGISGLAVVSTKVGSCEDVIQGYGFVVPPANDVSLANAISVYIENPSKRKLDASNFSTHIRNQYSIQSVMPIILSQYKDIYN